MSDPLEIQEAFDMTQEAFAKSCKTGYVTNDEGRTYRFTNLSWHSKGYAISTYILIPLEA